jgi:cell division protein FtsX
MDIGFWLEFLFTYPIQGLLGSVVIVGAINLLLMLFGGVLSEDLPDKCTHFHEKFIVNGFWVMLVINIAEGLVTGKF